MLVKIICVLAHYPNPVLSLRRGALASARTSRHGRFTFSDVCGKTDGESICTVRDTPGTPEKSDPRPPSLGMAHVLDRGDEKNGAEPGSRRPRTRASKKNSPSLSFHLSRLFLSPFSSPSSLSLRKMAAAGRSTTQPRRGRRRCVSEVSPLLPPSIPSHSFSLCFPHRVMEEISDVADAAAMCG
jgi:hypothetical protein